MLTREKKAVAYFGETKNKEKKYVFHGHGKLAINLCLCELKYSFY